jgi:hypothetical protein
LALGDVCLYLAAVHIHLLLMKSLLYFTLLSVFLFCCPPVFAQRDSISLNTVILKTNQVAEARPIEKVYLHFDKPYYAVGDTAYFKAYLTYGLHQPSALSKIVYVDIISSRDSLVKTLMLPVKNGSAVGSFVLSQPDYKQDNYHIKAYTKWMANFEQEYFFNKTISVGNAINTQVSTTISFKRSVSNNVTQVNTTISYKDADGKPYANKKVSWIIASAEGEEIAKGKGNTDPNGLLNINFVNTRSADLSKAILTTSLDAGSRKVFDLTYSLKSVAAPVDVQFFPEGGNLIAGVRSKVAIKAIQSNGLGIDFNATVVDNAGNTVTTSSTQHAGMGMFALTPEPGKAYKVNVDFKDGTKGTYELPKIQSSGITLSLNATDTGRLYIKISADSSYVKSHLRQSFYIVGKSGQVICYAAQTPLANTIYSAYIPTSKFPTGIAQITLLNSAGQPVSERVVFIRHNDLLGVSMATDKPSYGRRQKVKLNLTAKSNLRPVDGDFSVSVIDESKVSVDETAETTILSSLLLTSDLKGYIEKPNYYFKQVNEKTAADLDLLMLTQGYRRFTYEEILANKTGPITYLPEQGIELTGTLRTLNGMPFKGGSVTLQIPDRYVTTRTVSDAEGRFKFSNLSFTDSAQVIISAKNNYNSKNLMLMIDGAGYPSLGKNPNYPDERLNIDTMMVTYLQNSKKAYENSRVLQAVVIKAKSLAKPVASHMDYPALSSLGSMPDHLLNADRFTGCNNMVSCLQTMLMGVTYDNNNFYVSRDYNAGRRIPMALYVKGMPVDFSYLNSLNAAEIESIEIFLKDELGLVNNSNQSNGVLVFNMKTAPKGTKMSLQELQDLLPQPSVVKMTPKGFSIGKVFYSPKYQVPNTSFGPDLRTTIYWNPRLATDATGKTSVEFFSADSKGTYRAVVEGMDKDGNLARSVYRFKVE